MERRDTVGDSATGGDLAGWLSWVLPADFLGRSLELESLEHAAVEAAAGSGQAVLIGGEPGVGKTTLAARFAASLADRGATVLAGRCNVDPLLPYEPFVEALRQHVGRIPPAELSDRLGPLGHELSRLLPELGRVGGFQLPLEGRPAPGSEMVDLERHHLFESVAELLTSAGAQGPIVLVLDNLQWADPPTLRLLTYLLQRAAATRLLVIGTYRDTEVGPAHPLAVLWGERNVRRLNLAGLAPADTAALVAASGQVADPDGSIGGVLHRRTGGNPLYVSELLLALQGREGSEAIRAAASQLPEDLRLLIGLRLGRLSPETRKALTAAAVVGDDFDLATLELLPDAGGDSDQLLDALDEAVTAGVVAEVPRLGIGYRFAHDLFRQALYEDVLPLRRARLHRQVGLALESSTTGDPDERLGALAHHFIEAAVLGDIDKAVDYCLRAARQASNQQAFGRTIGLVERMLALVPHGQDWLEVRAELLIELSRALALSSDEARGLAVAFQAADVAREARSPLLLAKAAVLALRFATTGEQNPAAEALCKEALEGLSELSDTSQADALRAEILGRYSWYRSFTGNDAEEGRVLAEEAATLARRSGDRAALGFALYALAASLLCTPEAGRGLALAEEIQAIGLDLGDMELYSRGVRVRALGQLYVGDAEGFADACARLRAVFNELQLWLDGADVALWEGTLALLQGRFAEVQETIGEMLTHGGHELNYRNSAAAQTLVLHREQGQAAALLPLALASAEANPTIPTFRAAVAILHADLGQLEEARLLLDALASDEFGVIPRDFVWIIAIVLLVEVVAMLGDAVRARVLFELLSPFSGLTAMGSGVYCAGAVDRYLAMLASTVGDDAAAERLFAAADEVEAAMGARPLRCRTRLWWARHRRGRDANAAKAMAAEYVSEAEELGMPAVALSLRELAG
jgi:hypothetical protein